MPYTNIISVWVGKVCMVHAGIYVWIGGNHVHWYHVQFWDHPTLTLYIVALDLVLILSVLALVFWDHPTLILYIVALDLVLTLSVLALVFWDHPTLILYIVALDLVLTLSVLALVFCDHPTITILGSSHYNPMYRSPRLSLNPIRPGSCILRSSHYNHSGIIPL